MPGVRRLGASARSEALEAERKRQEYWRLHAAGKTEEAKADLKRLAQIRKEREEAAKKRAAEKAGVLAAGPMPCGRGRRHSRRRCIVPDRAGAGCAAQEAAAKERAERDRLRRQQMESTLEGKGKGKK